MTQKTLIGYKTLKEDGTSKNGNSGKWVKGRWKKIQGSVSICNNGFHACEKPWQLFNYIYGPRVAIVEARGTIEHSDDKFVSSEMRVVAQVLTDKMFWVRLAIKFAWRTLPHFESKYPDDKRVREALVAAERWVINPTDANASAARSAAESAAESAAWSAARSAARSAAWSAARSAAESAASAARSAAWSAAESAAESAASAARSAAESAAESAARSAAWSAAWSAEREWQSKTFLTALKKALKSRTPRKRKEAKK